MAESLVLQGGHSPVKIMTAEEMIRKVLMHSLGITERQLKEFENRPRGMVKPLNHAAPPASKKFRGNWRKMLSFSALI